MFISPLAAHEFEHEEAYATRVQKTGVFLGLLDLQLLALHFKRKIMMVFYDTDFTDFPKVVPLTDMLRRLTPGVPCPSSSDEEAEPWYIAGVSADWQRREFRRISHFVPLFAKSSMGLGLWDMLAGGSMSKMTDRLARMCPETDDGQSGDEFERSMRELAKTLEDQIKYTKMMNAIDLHVAPVPADGDCAIWSFLALDGGVVKRAQGASREHVARLRQDTCSCFIVFLYLLEIFFATN